jgi:hypothetical protein
MSRCGRAVLAWHMLHHTGSSKAVTCVLYKSTSENLVIFFVTAFIVRVIF